MATRDDIGQVGAGVRDIERAAPVLTGHERLVTGGQLMPCQALARLRAELAARGVDMAGMTVTRWQGVLVLAGGPGVRYCRGWLFWPAGRLSRRGRPLCAVHSAGDPAGAARRLAACPASAAPAGNRQGRRAWVPLVPGGNSWRG